MVEQLFSYINSLANVLLVIMLAYFIFNHKGGHRNNNPHYSHDIGALDRDTRRETRIAQRTQRDSIGFAASAEHLKKDEITELNMLHKLGEYLGNITPIYASVDHFRANIPHVKEINEHLRSMEDHLSSINHRVEGDFKTEKRWDKKLIKDARNQNRGLRRLVRDERRIASHSHDSHERKDAVDAARMDKINSRHVYGEIMDVDKYIKELRTLESSLTSMVKYNIIQNISVVISHNNEFFTGKWTINEDHIRSVRRYIVEAANYCHQASEIAQHIIDAEQHIIKELQEVHEAETHAALDAQRADKTEHKNHPPPSGGKRAGLGNAKFDGRGR